MCVLFFFFKQKTAYEMRISDWSSDVCSSDLVSQDLRHSQSLSEEASRAEDQYQRWSNEFSQFERDGYALNKNLSQDFVRYAQTAMMDPQNRHLDQSYHPGLVNMTPTQDRKSTRLNSSH